MRIVIVVLFIVSCGGTVFAEEPEVSLLMMEGAVPTRSVTSELIAFDTGSTSNADTTANKTLDEMLSQFESNPTATDLSYNSWTFTTHRFLGYTILLGSVTQTVLGLITYQQERDGKLPGTAHAHKYLGYTIAGLSMAQTALGSYNFWQLRRREAGRSKRWWHLTFSTMATAGFVTAALIANNSRHQVDSGEAALKGKSFGDLYDTHRMVGLLSTASVLLTAIVIVW